jgi:hypothetical protein
VQWYEAASASLAPHREFDSAIQVGLAAARKAGGVPEPAKSMAAAASVGFASAAPTNSRAADSSKPLSWGEFDAPPVWGHGAHGDTIHKPDFSHEMS